MRLRKIVAYIITPGQTHSLLQFDILEFAVVLLFVLCRLADVN